MSSESAEKKRKWQGIDAASSPNGQKDGDETGTAEELLVEMRAVLGQNFAHMTRMQHEMDAMKRKTESLLRRLANDPELENRCRPVGSFVGARMVGAEILTQSEENVLNIVQNRQRNRSWPLKSRRAETFATDPELNRLRLFSSALVKHDPELMGKTAENKSGVKSCVLCISGKIKKNVRFHCSLCSVPLCRTKWPGFELSCYEAWHTVPDLGEERKRRKKATERDYAQRRESTSVQEDDDWGVQEGEKETMVPRVEVGVDGAGVESAGVAI